MEPHKDKREREGLRLSEIIGGTTVLDHWLDKTSTKIEPEVSGKKMRGQSLASSQA